MLLLQGDSGRQAGRQADRQAGRQTILQSGLNTLQNVLVSPKVALCSFFPKQICFQVTVAECRVVTRSVSVSPTLLLLPPPLPFTSQRLLTVIMKHLFFFNCGIKLSVSGDCRQLVLPTRWHCFTSSFPGLSQCQQVKT